MKDPQARDVEASQHLAHAQSVPATAPNFTLQDFDYHLPSELIAQSPAKQRNQSRLLHIDSQGQYHDRQFIDFPSLLKPNDLLVFNNTKVIKARLYGQKASGGKLEALIERLIDDYHALAHLRAAKAPKPGSTVYFADGQIQAMVTGREDDLFALRFTQPILDILDQYGHVPLPPYIEHDDDSSDEQRYQTVYAKDPGAVAAPTAGLHFDEAMLQTLKELGIHSCYVTLHVGAGTFQPVRVEYIKDHIMHAERYRVDASVTEAIAQTRRLGGRVIAVGTTSLRALESAASQGGLLQDQDPQAPQRCPIPHSDDTRLFITPGYQFKVIDGLFTNFHLPQSTLLMLVSALAGIDTIKQAYAHAIEARYRFFSYGDAMFIEPR